MKKILFILYAMIVCSLDMAPVILQAQEVDPQQVLGVIQERIETLKDISTTLTQTNLSQGTTTKFYGTLQFKSPDKFKADIEISDAALNKLKSLSVYDGNVLWQEQTEGKSEQIKVFKSVIKSNAPAAIEFMKQFNPKEQLLGLIKDYSVIAAKEEVSAESVVYVLELEIKPKVRQKMTQMMKAFSNDQKAGELIPDRVTIYWDTKIGYIHELNMYSRNQELKLHTLYTDTKINSGINEAVFSYKVPKEAKIIDVSDIMSQEVAKKELEGTEHELVGSEFPEFALPNIYGQTVKNDLLRGKVGIVNFWEHWCPPCKKELPVIESLYQSLFAEEAQIITITSDQEQAVRVIEENNYSFPVLVDVKSTLAEKLQVQSIPRTYIVDKTGRIAAVYIGFHPDIKEKINQHIQALNIDEE